MRHWRISLLGIVAALVLLMPVSAQDNNLLQDGSFETEQYTLASMDTSDDSRYHVPSGWGGGVIRTPGAPSWINAHPTGFPHTAGYKRSGGRSFHMARGGATFTAYVYQQVSVTPNTPLSGGAWAYLENNADGIVRVGIDPTGGTDPFSPSVVWSPWNSTHNSWTNISVSTNATSGTATLFLYATQNTPANPNGVYWDDAYLNGTAGQATITTAPDAPANTRPMATATANIRIRRGPGIDQPRIAAMAAGQSYPLVEDLGAWYAIEYNGEIAYISSAYATVGAGSAPASNTASTPGGSNAPVNTGTTIDYYVDYTLKMRSGPSADSGEILTIPHTAVVQAVARSQDSNWLLVNYEGQSGWVAAWIGRLDGSISNLPAQ